jgi:DNA-binding NarL/FixJ family response regulator
MSPIEPLYPLTRTEIEVVRLLARGESSQGVARQLHMSGLMVRQHIQSILEKLQVHSRLEATVRARDLGLLD